MQTKVTRLVSNGSSFGFVWTWSKALDYESNEELNSLSFPYPTYWQKNYGPASFDRGQNFEIYGVFQLPFGKGQRWVTSGVGNQIPRGMAGEYSDQLYDRCALHRDRCVWPVERKWIDPDG